MKLKKKGLVKFTHSETKTIIFQSSFWIFEANLFVAPRLFAVVYSLVSSLFCQLDR